jgi:pimeloyl-ACP methyl ester carboxylesterase
MERVTLRGVELAYEITGSGPRSLVWGHGLSSNRHHEDELGYVDWSAAADGNRRVRYDARGHGESTFTSEPTGYGWDELARDQLALADELGIGRYVAGGASMGCGTALHAALLAPDRIGALLLVIPPTAWETRQERVDIWEQVASLIERKGIEAFIEGMEAMPRPDPLVGRTDRDEAFERNARSADPRRLAGVFRGAGYADLPPREQLAGLGLPALVLAWSGDPAHPESTAHQLAELLPRAELHVAHTGDDLRTWTDRAARFLRSLPGSG